MCSLAGGVGADEPLTLWRVDDQRPEEPHLEVQRGIAVAVVEVESRRTRGELIRVAPMNLERVLADPIVHGGALDAMPMNRVRPDAGLGFDLNALADTDADELRRERRESIRVADHPHPELVLAVRQPERKRKVDLVADPTPQEDVAGDAVQCAWGLLGRSDEFGEDRRLLGARRDATPTDELLSHRRAQRGSVD